MTSPIHVVRTIDAPAAAVFATWTASTTLVEPVTEVEMDLVVGGALRLSTGDGPTADLVGRFLVVEHPRRLRYSWRWGGGREESIVDVAFTELGLRTVTEVEHRGFLDEASRQTHLDGWVAYLNAVPRFL